MKQLERYAPITEELENFYSSLDPQSEYFKVLIDDMLERMKDASSFALKAEQTRILAAKSTVHVFRYFPFYFQFSAGRTRYIWGGLEAVNGGFGLCRRLGAAYTGAYDEATRHDREEAYLHCWDNPVGHDHHCLNYDDILALGLKGLRARAEAGKASLGEEKHPFYDAVLSSLDSLTHLALRFSAEAKKLLETETDPAAQKNLSRIAETAARIPMEPAGTFYEALCAILFCRECVGTLEGIGISTFGQLDRMLAPYYEADLAAGRITPDEAKDLLHCVLLYTAVRFSENTSMKETSTTIMVGGCDREGTPVFNEVTRLLVEAELEGRYVNTKFDCRISKAHPGEYLALLGRIQLAGLAVLVYQNDDTHIPARVKQGMDVEDARLYAAGGCHEIVLAGTEVCTRADTWISLPRILLDTMERGEYESFDAFYAAAIQDVENYHKKVEGLKNAAEEHWWEFNPMPLYSAMMTGCLTSGLDVTQGGAKYSTTALSMVAPATFVDSLRAVKTLVFEEKRCTMQELWQLARNDFADNEPLRQYIVNRLPKHCTGDEAMDEFSAKVLHDLSGVSGRKNGRGGKYLPAFYAHDIFRPLGLKLGATPDGRKAGYWLTRGISPSEFVKGPGPLSLLQSIRAYDFTDFVDSFALEITLPKLDTADSEAILMSLFEEFLDAGGSTLQLNILDTEDLRLAQQHPEEHRDIIVRVCGYSDYFVNLIPEIQEEVISRHIRTM